MTMMGGAGRNVDPTVKPLVVSVKTGKLFVVLKSADDIVSGKRFVFIARPRHLNDMRRITRERFDQLFRAFAEPPPSTTDPRIAFTNEDFYAALDQEVAAPPVNPAPPVRATQPVQKAAPEAAAVEEAPKRKRGRPKGSKNKPKAPQVTETAEQIAQRAGVLPKDGNQTQTEQETADAVVNAQSL